MTQEEILQMYEEAIEFCEMWRLGNNRFKIAKATPNQLHLYNIFTQAKNNLSGHLATMKDSLGIYMKEPKK